MKMAIRYIFAFNAALLLAFLAVAARYLQLLSCFGNVASELVAIAIIYVFR